MREPVLNTPPPERIDHPPIQKALAGYRDLIDQLGQADRHAAEAERAVLAAAEGDREQLAAAIRAGRKDPGEAKLETAKQKRDAQVRQVEALELAVADAARELRSVVETERAGWDETLATRTAELRVRFGETLDQLTHVHGEIAATIALRSWLAGDTAGVPGRWVPGRHGGRLTSLTAPSGDPLVPAQAIAALREVAEPPAPKPKPQVQPLQHVTRAA